MTRRSNGAVPPHEPEREQAVLSAAMTSRTARDAAVAAGLTVADLYSGEHQAIWQVVATLAEPSDPVAVAAELRRTETMRAAGGAQYLGQLVSEVPWIHPDRVAEHVGVIVDAARRRRVIDTAHRVAAEGYTSPSAAVYVERAAEQIAEASRDVPRATGPTVLDGPAIAGPLGELDYLVPSLGLVAGGGAPHLVAGYGYSGKTLAMQALALQLAAGVAVWGVYPCRRRRVVHVDLEQGERLTRRRYQRLARAAGIDLAGLGDAIALVVMPTGMALTPECAPAWLALMTGRDLLILDSLRAATPGRDENDSSIRDVLDMLGHWSEATGCRVLVIHHARKPSGDGEADARMVVRGSSAIFDGCDGIYVFAGAKGEPVSCEAVKARSHGDLGEPLALTIADVEIDGVKRAGVAVRASGIEAVVEAREARAEEAAGARAARDATVVRRVLGQSPGLGTMALRAAGPLSGARLAAALVALGTDVERREVVVGRTRSVGHWLTATVDQGWDA